MDWPEIYRRLWKDQNDESGWLALEQRVRPWAHASFRLRGVPLVEDAVAETCVSVVVSLEKAHGGDTFAGFVRGHWMNVRNRIRAAPPTIPFVVELHDRPAADSSGVTPDERDLLAHCLSQLPAREREAITLRYHDDAASEHIAEILDVKVGNARRILFNGLARLRECAKRYWPQGRG